MRTDTRATLFFQVFAVIDIVATYYKAWPAVVYTSLVALYWAGLAVRREPKQ